MPHLTIDSRKDCYILDQAKMDALQNTANTTELEPGTYVIRINSGDFSYWTQDKKFPAEPWVLLWVYGGEVRNKKTNKLVGCTWSSLNGYDDTLTLDVLKTTKISALFFDTHKEDNEGEVTLAILKDA
jgi:hypothetical protein